MGKFCYQRGFIVERLALFRSIARVISLFIINFREILFNETDYAREEAVFTLLRIIFILALNVSLDRIKETVSWATIVYIFLEERSSPFIHFVPLFSRIYITTLHYENIEKFQRSQIQ